MHQVLNLLAQLADIFLYVCTESLVRDMGMVNGVADTIVDGAYVLFGCSTEVFECDAVHFVTLQAQGKVDPSVQGGVQWLVLKN